MRAAPGGALAALLLLAAGVTSLPAQEGLLARPRPALSAVRAVFRPVLDGDVIGDGAWQDAPAASDLVQTTPEEGAAASQRTEVRVMFDDEAIYIGVICYDDDPGGIIVADARRDADLDETDSFQVIFDTFQDRQNGFLFGTNPVGQEYDGQVAREGQGGNGVAGFNLDWDGSWEVAAQRGEFGWSAEMAIPFRTLRFAGSHEPQSWGMNFQRNIRRRNETAYWAPLPRQLSIFRLSAAGSLDGLVARAPRNLKITPYGLARVRRPGDAGAGTHSNGEVGFDLKYSLTPGLTLDVTYNTDFAQVEADVQQINLDRFNLFFPEKRPFFLENAGLFSVGEPGEIELFFSRRIGIGPDGTPVPILGGVRVTGKTDGTNVGFLSMQTEEVPGVADVENYTVARVSRELRNRGSIGVLLTNRQSMGDQPGSEEYGRTFALDGRAGIGDYGRVKGFLAFTETPVKVRNTYAGQLKWDYDSERWYLNAGYTEVGEGFDPQVGFLQRTSYRNPGAGIFRRFRLKSGGPLLEVRPHASYEGYWGHDGFQESGFLHMDNHLQWQQGQELHTAVNVTREGVREPFEIYPGVVVPAATYDNSEVSIQAFSNRGARLSAGMEATAGGFFSGDRLQLEPDVRIRFGDRFNTDLGWQYNDVDLPEGRFKTNLGLWRVSYSFTPRMFLESLLQYNDRDDQFSANVRFGWLQTANVGLFVVYNDIREIGPLGPPQADRSVTVKWSWQFDVLR